MTCPLSRSLFEDYADNELDSQKNIELKSHLETCARCKIEYESIIGLKQLLANQLVPNPGDLYRQETRELILSKTVNADSDSWTNVSTQTKQSFFQSIISVAASLCIFGSALLLGAGGNPFQSQIEPISLEHQAKLARLANPEKEVVQVLSTHERKRIADATILIGPAGMLGRMTGTELIAGIR